MTNEQKLWKEIFEKLEIMMSSPTVDTWLSKLVPIAVRDNSLVLQCHNESAKRVMTTKFINKIKQAASDCNSFIKDFIFITEDESSEYKEKNQENSLATIDTYFNPNYTFDSFVVGSCNEFVTASAVHTAEKPGELFNPLFIYGGVGLGKTHLLHAIGNRVLELNPNARILYTTTENFLNDFLSMIRTASLRENAKEAFRKKYRELDYLLIDDIQFLQGKSETQEALFHIFNELHSSGKQIVITSDRSVNDNLNLEARLVSRFSWGLMADIQPPSIETRIAILQRKAFEYHININDDVIRYIAEKNTVSIRTLEGMLKTVIFYQKLNAYRTIDQLSLAKEALKNYADEGEEKLTSETILNKVCSYFNISRDMIISKKRNKELVEPRQIAMYLITDLLPLVPLTTIGTLFGDRDHSTIIHARDKIADLIEKNEGFRAQVVEIKNKILNN